MGTQAISLGRNSGETRQAEDYQWKTRNFGSILYYKGVFTYNKFFYAIKYFFISDQYK